MTSAFGVVHKAAPLGEHEYAASRAIMRHYPAGSEYDMPIHHARALVRRRPERDQGQIDRVADSIRREGQVHPVVVQLDHAGNVDWVHGHHRIAASHQLGHKTVRVRVVDSDWDMHDPAKPGRSWPPRDGRDWRAK